MILTTTRNIFLTLGMAGVIFPAFGQDQDCSESLDEARRLFDSGKLEKVEPTLEPCMKDGFTKSQKTEAYQIIILTQQYDNRPADAEETFLELLEHDPEFEVNEENTPEELLHLVNKHHAPPVWNAGLIFGPVITNARRTNSYSTGNASNETKEYTSNSLGYVIGVKVNRFITKDIEIGAEIQLMRQSFKSTSDQFGFATIESAETQDWVQLPIMGTYDFSHGKWEPYVSLGVVPAYMIAANAEIKRTVNSGANSGLGDVTGPDIDMISQRNQFNIASLFAAGVKYKIPRAFLLLEARHSWYFLNQVKSEERFKNPELLYQYYYVDDNFNIGNIQIMLGFTYSFHKIKARSKEDRKKQKMKDKDGVSETEQGGGDE